MPAAALFREGSISGYLHVPEGVSHAGLVLTHGAGANCEAPLLVAVANAFESSGYIVLRCDLPFRQKRRSGPPHPSQAEEDRQGLRAAVEAMRRLVTGRVILGGHSYGGRQASMLASSDQSVCDALLLLSYPLHPPGKPEQLRTAHWANLETPAVFVHGTKDAFGTVDEMKVALELLPARHVLSIVEGAGHDLKRGRWEMAQLIFDPLHGLLQ